MATAVDKVGMASVAVTAYKPQGVTRAKAASPAPVAQPAVSNQEPVAPAVREEPRVSEKPVEVRPLNDQEAIKQLGFDNAQVRVDFSKDEETGEIVMKMVDRESGEVVREIPPEELRHVAKVLRDLAAKHQSDQKGQLVDKIVT